MMRSSVVLVALLASSVRAEEASKQILLIGSQSDHPAGSHEYLPTCRLLASCLNRVAGVEAIVSDGWPETTADQLGAIVLYRAPFVQAMFDGPHSREIVSHLDRGAGLVAIHWATGILPEHYDRLAGRMAGYQGGAWRSDGSKVAFGQSLLAALQPEHPILRGVSLPSIRDEWYFDTHVHPDARPLWSVTARDEPLTVAWTFERPDGGRTFATTLGHYWNNFTSEPFRRAIVNGVLWSAQIDVPESGADVEMGFTNQ